LKVAIIKTKKTKFGKGKLQISMFEIDGKNPPIVESFKFKNSEVVLA